MRSCISNDLGDFLSREGAPLPRLKSTERQRPNCHTHQTQCRKSNRSRHAPHLSIHAFVQRDFDPRGRHMLPEPDRHRAIRHRWRIGEHSDFRRLGEMVSGISLSHPLHPQLYLFSRPFLDKIPEPAWIDDRQLTHLI
jgi:hypothetical protein